MSQPITWQNVNQGDASTAWRAMDSAQRSINGAFDGVQSQITKSEDIQAKNDVAIKQNNTQDFLNKLNALGKTPEALQAAIADGSVEQLKAGYGNAIDHNAVRGAAEGLLDQRYKQVKQGVDFNNAMLDEKLAPIMDKFKSAVLAGNKELADKYRSEYTAADGKHGSDLESFLRNNTHENQVWDEQQKGWVRDQGLYEANLKNMTHQQRMAEGQLGVAQGQLGIARENLNMNKQDRLDARLGAAVEGLGKARSTEAGSAEGTAAVFAGIAANIKDESSNVNARRAFGEILKKFPNISTADALAAVLTMDNTRVYKIDSLIRSGAVDSAGKFMGTEDSKAREASASLQRAAAELRYKDAKAAAEAGPGATKRTVAIDRAAAAANPVAAPVAPTPAPAVVAPLPPPVVAPTPEQAKVATMEDRLKRESDGLNRGTITDLSPEVKAYARQKSEDAKQARRQEDRARMEASIQRDLKEARIRAQTSRDQYR